jgi:hypothetical protein
MTEFAKITDADIEAFVTKLGEMKTAYHERERQRRFPKNTPQTYTFAYDKGRKYIRIVTIEHGRPGGVYCFLDFFGNIWKPASYKGPELNQIRGHIADENIWSNGTLGAYGVAYLTGHSVGRF